MRELEEHPAPDLVSGVRMAVVVERENMNRQVIEPFRLTVRRDARLESRL